METGIELIKLAEERVIAFKEEMQEAFESGFQGHIKEDGENQWQVLPDGDFYQSLRAEGAEAYEAIDADGQRVGGAIITIDSVKHHGELAFLYVKVGVQGKGTGQAIWRAIEAMHPRLRCGRPAPPISTAATSTSISTAAASTPSSSSTPITVIRTCPNSSTPATAYSCSRNA